MTDDAFARDLENVKADMAKLRTDVSELTHALRNTASDKATDAKSRLADEIREAREALQSRLGEAREYGRQRIDQLEGRVGEHPLGSLLTAFGVGFVIAKLMDLGGRH